MTITQEKSTLSSKVQKTVVVAVLAKVNRV